MIPDEAIEASARSFYGVDYGDIMAYEDVQYATNQILKALEAAAPHIRAEALESAADAIRIDGDPRDTPTINWLKARAGAERSHSDAV